MDRLIWLDGAWQFLTRDIAIVQGFQSPMLSWLGAGGILMIFLWHSCALIRASVRIRLAFHRICPVLARLIHERQSASKEWIVIPSLAKKQSPLAQVQGGRRDLDDLQSLDRTMRAEHTFAGEWLSYRKSFSIEQPSWFIEPTVHTKRSAAEFFTLENVCAGSMDVRFYQQLPSIITGVGLTFTFLAILIGLSKLHANGSQIEGLQGLINGLAGKFMTSIIGLTCANLFVFIEKSLFYRLTVYHRQFVSMLDEMFPHKVHDHGTHHAPPGPGQTVPMTTHSRSDSLNRHAESLSQRLGATVTALTAVSESLSTLGTSHSAFNQDELARTIGSTIKKELSPLLDPLHEAIRELTRSIAAMRRPAQLSPADMEGLVETFKDRLGDNSGRDTQQTPPRSALNRLSWMFPQSGTKQRHEAVLE